MYLSKVSSALVGGCLLFAVALVYAIENTPEHMVFSSDTQYPWTDKTDRREPESDADFERRSKWLVESQLASIAEFRNQQGGLSKVPLMINGDITAFGHGWQRTWMRAALDKHFKGDYLYGLGNHDYENNVDDCFTNNCAAGSIVEFAEHHKDKVDDFDLRISGGLKTIYSGSLAYSVNIGEVHMVQLNNEPAYTARIAHALNPTIFNISSTLDWLENDLMIAKAQGYAIIINMHKPHAEMGSVEDSRRFRDMVKKYEVTAIFAGHYHDEGGEQYAVNSVPLFISGSASQQTYLTASFSPDRKQLHVYLVRDNQWRNRQWVSTVPVKSLWARQP